MLAMVSASGAILMAQANDLDHRLPRPRDPLDRALRAGRLQPQAGRVGRGGAQVLRPRRVLLGHLRLRRSPSPTAPPGPPTSPRSPTSWPTTCSSTTGCCWPGCRSCSSASPSRWRRCRSTCGPPTSTRARRRRSPASWPRWPRPAASRPSSGCSSPPSGCSRADWRPIIYVLAVVTLVVGAGLAVVQRDIKRMLAYSLDQPRRLRAARPAGGQRRPG